VTVSGLQPQTVVIGTERRRRRAEEAGGRPAAMLVSEMEHLGPVSAGDEQLLDALGWTRPRAVDLLNQLEAAGVVRSHVERRDGPGRPRKLYELRPATEFVA
jgi:predicted ArsR family transcriptional regulator